MPPPAMTAFLAMHDFYPSSRRGADPVRAPARKHPSMLPDPEDPLAAQTALAPLVLN